MMVGASCDLPPPVIWVDFGECGRMAGVIRGDRERLTRCLWLMVDAHFV